MSEQKCDFEYVQFMLGTNQYKCKFCGKCIYAQNPTEFQEKVLEVSGSCENNQE